MMRGVVAAAALLVLLADGALIASGAHRAPLESRARRRELQGGISTRSDLIEQAQHRSDVLRGTVLESFQSMNDVLRRARSAQTLGGALERWPRTLAKLDSARRATLDLPSRTSAVLRLSRRTKGDLRELQALDPASLSSLLALESAYDLLVETQGVFTRLNEAVGAGLVVYQDLAGVTRNFLREYRGGVYRDGAQAADVYSFRTERFDVPLLELREKIGRIQARARDLVTETEKAFARWREG